MSKILNDIANLARRIREVEKDPDEIEYMEKYLTERIEKFPKYFSSVIMMETQMKIAAQLYDREDYQDRVMSWDRSRRMSHIAAANAINQINRLCIQNYDMEPIFKFPSIGDRPLKPEAEIPGNAMMERAAKDDRELAADAIYGFCKEVFLDARSKERYNQIEGYDREERDKELHEIGENSGYFNQRLSLDELIAQVKETDTESEKGTYSKNRSNYDDISL